MLTRDFPEGFLRYALSAGNPSEDSRPGQHRPIDYLLKVAVRDLEEFSELTMQKLLRYPGVRSITSGLMLQVLKQQRGYPVLPPASARTG